VGFLLQAALTTTAAAAAAAAAPTTGLAATLGLIKDKGLLKDKTQWAGRNNDKKPVALIGLEDVYTGVRGPWGV
jgi:hypothetical protein